MPSIRTQLALIRRQFRPCAPGSRLLRRLAREHAAVMTRQAVLVESCVPMAWKEALRFKRGNPSVDAEDIAAACFLGLVEAAQRYQPASGNRFTTYAMSYIRPHAIKQRRKDYLIAVPEYAYADVRARLAGKPLSGRSAYLDEAEQALRPVRSLSDWASRGRGVSRPADLVQDVPPERPYGQDELQRLRAAMATLTERERRVILEHLDGRTLEHIAGDYGLTRERIRQVEKEGMDRLRAALRPETGPARKSREIRKRAAS